MSGGGEMFSDGAAYERLMGRWSSLVAEQFLDWLAVPKGLRWLDVGCGNGAFTETLIGAARQQASWQSTHPWASSPMRARGRPRGWPNSAWATRSRLPLGDDSFDAAVMAR